MPAAPVTDDFGRQTIVFLDSESAQYPASDTPEVNDKLPYRLSRGIAARADDKIADHIGGDVRLVLDLLRH